MWVVLGAIFGAAAAARSAAADVKAMCVGPSDSERRDEDLRVPPSTHANDVMAGRSESPEISLAVRTTHASP